MAAKSGAVTVESKKEKSSLTPPSKLTKSSECDRNSKDKKSPVSSSSRDVSFIDFMFSVGPNYNKLKTNLRLAVNRLKLLGKKKTELAQKSRKEIADFITDHKEDRARIKVEYIIREDYMVEAYELLEMYCDTLLARFGLIQQMKTLDEGLEEAVNSVVWAAPRLLSEVQEFKIISDQMAAKFGKPFVEACRENQFNKVNPKLLQKMSVAAPPKVLVERYMMEIAKSHGVPFTPDQAVIREDEVANAEAMLIDFQNKGQHGYGYQYPPVPPPDGSGPPAFNYPPGPPPGGFGGGGGGAMAYPAAPPQQPFDYSSKPPPAYPQFSKRQGIGFEAVGSPSPKRSQSVPQQSTTGPVISPKVKVQKKALGAKGPLPQKGKKSKVPKSDRLSQMKDELSNFTTDPGPVPDKLIPGQEGAGSTGGPPSAPDPNAPGFMNLPDVPGDSWNLEDSAQPGENKDEQKPGVGNSEGSNAGAKDDVDFDDLARRFEDLKKKH